MRATRLVPTVGALLLLPVAALAAGEPQGGMLDVNVTMVVQIVNYVVFVLLMNAVLFRPMIEHLDARRREVQEAEEKAELAAKETRRVDRKRAAALQAALVEASRARHEIKGAAVDEYQKTVHEARVAADERIQAAQDEFVKEAEEVSRQMEAEVGEFSRQVKAKLLAGQVPAGSGGEA